MRELVISRGQSGYVALYLVTGGIGAGVLVHLVGNSREFAHVVRVAYQLPTAPFWANALPREPIGDLPMSFVIFIGVAMVMFAAMWRFHHHRDMLRDENKARALRDIEERSLKNAQRKAGRRGVLF